MRLELTFRRFCLKVRARYFVEIRAFMNRPIAVLGIVGGWLASSWTLAAADPVDFNRQIKPIFEANCVSCHGAERPKGAFRMLTREDIIKGGDDGTGLVPGEPDKSPIYTSMILSADHEDVMPPPQQGGPLPGEIAAVVRQWIAEGAKWPEGVKLEQVQRIDFVKDVQPILEFNCVACHREGEAKGKLRLDTKEEAFTSGEYYGPTIVPFEPEKSRSYTSTILPEDDIDLMPPSNKGGPLPKEVTDILRMWIEQGAPWPDGVTLTPKKAEEAPRGDEMATIQQIHELIVKNTKEKSPAEMKPYRESITGTGLTFGMAPIPGGVFLMGSPATEEGRKDDEGPQVQVAISPFWMGTHEVTWNEYELFMRPEMELDLRKRNPSDEYVNQVADAVSRPTKPYVEMSFGMGKDGFPAISMTQHAANKYCQWLSARTGHFYRLPTEAEWEYACRAGTTTAYSFGNDPAELDQYAWWGKNSDWKYQKVGQKKPNPWGLYDMHGNVVEWCLDQYDPDWFKKNAGQFLVDPWNRATKPYPHVVRGGSWDDEDAEALRSAARRGSHRNWKIQDPQLPKSIWYHTDAQFLGFRVVRPLKVPTAEEMNAYWNSGVHKD
jgi:formylglycine-generating enzyme required for sulfatase activity/mono/diheme cytochrome c family protein